MDLSDSSTGGLDPQSRRRAIMDHVVRVGATSVDDLAQMLAVSAMTVYRDVAELERSELIHRKRGEITAAESSLTESSSRLRMSMNEGVKTALATAASMYLQRGQSVMVDDSSSTIPLIGSLPQFAPITLVTNAEFVAQQVRSQPDVRLLLVGGEYEAWADAYFGELAEAAISRLSVDVCMMSATALTPRYCFHPNENVARVKRAMLAVARQKILLVDSTKFTKSALYRVGPTTDFDTVITDACTPRSTINELEEQGLTVEIVNA